MSFSTNLRYAFLPYVCTTKTNTHQNSNIMETAMKAITVETTVKAPIEKVWAAWGEPKHIMQWCHASDDWHAPYADNDLRTGGTFKTTMAAKDGSFSFDFGGVYDNVEKHKLIEYKIEDGRKVKIAFSSNGASNRHEKPLLLFIRKSPTDP